MKPLVGLSVSIDGAPAVCIACAERCADGGFAHLFWMANCLERCDGAATCPECGGQMAGDKAQEAAGRVVAFLKLNSKPRPPQDGQQREGGGEGR